MSETEATPLLHQKKGDDGYVRVYLPDHPDAEEGYVFLHRLVMETAIGGRLPRGAEVHHKDRNPRNNALANLQLLPEPLHEALHNAERRQVAAATEECDAWAADALDALRFHFEDARKSVPPQWSTRGGAAELAARARATADARGIAVIQGKFDTRLREGVANHAAPEAIAAELKVHPQVVRDRIRMIAGAVPVFRRTRPKPGR